MRLGKNWKTVRQKSVGYARRLWDRRGMAWPDVERSLRRRMRIFPGTPRDRVSTTEDSKDLDGDADQLDLRPPDAGRAASGWRDPELKVNRPKPIISIHGDDVDDEDLESSDERLAESP